MPRLWIPSLAVALAAAAALTVLVAVPPASADTGQRTDRAGDAPGIIDITRVTVRNDRSRVVITSHVPGLKTRGGFAWGYSTSPNGGLLVFADKIAGRLVVEATYCGEITCHDVTCRGLRVRWMTAKHRLSAIIPQRCYPAPLPSPGVFTATSASKDDYDYAGVLRVPRG
ncbi:MAG TPA: hypothetical protein PLZ93_08805 [Nocardioides sp.]|uniref:hypothetical protein n=1 Tax=uncultured Nocardioides sp. TaxID=198441 RepID=UPI000EE41BC6|nr:hypothetical protein [uncultured Nocardioides sp.]HCB07781.1 hypothetical protein [Nocardioides sp.]HRD62426.1 hypothetical protein [Nocardioides sp.]HRI95699.1 hypothetical protein [Nocardioides sp.]HRK44706.1 hypothetical protein [Nocardioides sp.]